MTIRIEGPRDLLNAVPGLVGFIPIESIVVIVLNERLEVMVTARVDIKEAKRGSLMETWLSMRESGGRFAFVVVSTDDRNSIDGTGEFFIGLDLVFQVKDVLIVAGGQAGSTRCEDTGCCPFPFQWEPVPVDPDRPVLDSRKALEESLSHCEDVPPVTLVMDDLVDMLVANDPRTVNLDIVAGAFRKTCSTIPGRDMLLARVASGGGLPAQWMLAGIAQRVNTDQALSTLACLMYLTGNGAGTDILVERVEALGGTSLGLLIAQANRMGRPPAELREVFASCL